MVIVRKRITQSVTVLNTLLVLVLLTSQASAAPGDRDNDGLSDVLEHEIGTNTRNEDTDGDGLNDFIEVNFRYLISTATISSSGVRLTIPEFYRLDPLDPNDALADQDGDGLNNGLEILNGLDIYDPDDALQDSDNDGLSNLLEILNGLNYLDSADADQDFDSDGLSNLIELLNGLNHLDSTDALADFDNDGLSNAFEVLNGLNHEDAADALQDPDNDGLTNLEEMQLGTSVSLADSDQDGIPDGWEVEHGLNPLASDLTLDSDGDGLSNSLEYHALTLIFNPDSDGDGLSDGVEYYFRLVYDVKTIFYKTVSMVSAESFRLDPLDPSDAAADLDGDGLSNGLEILHGLDLLDASDAAQDTDNDGLSDLLEILNGLDRLDPNDAGQDADEDGLSDSFEILNGLNPADANDAHQDLDGDGLSNLEEYSIGSRIDLEDTDSDGLSDGWEIANGLNPVFSDLQLDSDLDGLSNAYEVSLGTSFNNADTDGDGLNDGLEVNFRYLLGSAAISSRGVRVIIPEFYRLDPLDPTDARADQDEDGLDNGQEILNGLDIYDSSDALQDTDIDGLSNLLEIINGLNHLDSSDAAQDNDNDGLSNLQEILNGLNHLDPDDALQDWDVDGLNNAFEIRNGLDLDDASDALQDQDGDGLNNLEEMQLGTSVSLADSDQDNIPDGWEVDNGLNPLESDLTLDSDGDGLGNVQEYFASTSVFNPDTDGDGLLDGLEYYFRINYNLKLVFYRANSVVVSDTFTLNPLDPSDAAADQDGDGMSNGFEILNGLDLLDPNDALQDLDGDGLNNIEEMQLGTSISNDDTDGDGLLDSVEAQYGLDPLDGADADLDNDGDGFSNSEEVLAGSDPFNNDETPSLMILSFSAASSSVASAGEPVLLHWKVQGAVSIRLIVSSEKQSIVLSELDGLADEGSITVNPALSSTYRLEASGVNDTVFSEIGVAVNDRDEAEIIPLWSENVFLSGGNGQRIKTSIVVTEEGVGYAGSFDGNLYRSSVNGEVSVFYENSGVVLGKPLLTEESIIFGASASGDYEGRVCSLTYDQTMAWVYDTQSSVIASPVLDEVASTLYVVTYQGVVTALDSTTGECLWEYSLPSEEVCATPVLSDSSTLVVHTLSKTVYSLNLNEISAAHGCGEVSPADAMNSVQNNNDINWSQSFGE